MYRTEKFEIGDDIICIDSDECPLTLHKTYYVVLHNTKSHLVRVVDDYSRPNDFFDDRFVKVEEYRKLKLDKICSKREI